VKRRAWAIALAGSLLGLAGCAPGYDPVLNPLGPVPGAKPVRFNPVMTVTPYSAGGQNAGIGYLKVDAPQEEAHVGSELFYPHLSYTLSQNGRVWFSRVRNHAYPADEQAQVVSLPPGRYLLNGYADIVGPVRVPVTIYEGRLTELNLAETRQLGD
jgi:hypothetical protein